jgi:hypothetical protein
VGGIIMTNNETLYNDFLKEMEILLKENQDNESAKGISKEKEHIERKMKLNVIEIFQRMFMLYYDNIFVGLKNKEFGKYISDYQTKEQGMLQAYNDIFSKITTPWAAKSEKDKLFGRQEEYQKEMLKLDMAKEIMEIFNKNYKNIYGEF